jgi:hypothetical protein
MVTVAFPVEESVTVCVVGVFTATLPNERLDVLTPSVPVEAPSCTAKVFATLPALAVSVAVVAVVTALAVAVKPVLVAPAGTVMFAGTVKEVLLLARLTANPPVAAAVLIEIVQLSVPAPVIEPLPQVNPLSTGNPVPLSAIADEVPFDELLVSVSCPVAAPAAVGSNCTVNAAV